jgi:phosphatidylinositol-3-phosphatase
MHKLSTSARLLLTMSTILYLALLAVPLSLSSANAASTTVTLDASADTYLSIDSPHSNFGSAESLAISHKSQRALLRFELALPAGAKIESATLQTYSEVRDKAHFIVYASAGRWDEESVTYGTQPAWDSSELARSHTTLRKGKYAAADLPLWAVPTSGTVSFRLDTTASRRSGSIASRESAKAPQLVVTYSTDTASPSPAATSTAAAAAPSPTTATTAAAAAPSPTTTTTAAAAAPSPTTTTTTATPVPNAQSVTKVLTIVEENHSLEEMKAGMPYLYSLAQRFSYANNYVAIRHPSLPNYLAMAGGDTFGVTDDADPASHPLSGQSVFGQAIAQGRTAGVYAESMPGNCVQSGNTGKGYAVKHNPWPYFVDERALCNVFDIPETGFGAAAGANALPNAGMLIPNMCNDAHDCSLGTADSWLKNRLPNILASSDFASGKLAVVVTADEDDSTSGNKVLTVVLHASLDGSHKVVSTALTHYSLSRFYSQTTGGSPLRKAAAAPDMAEAFGLTVGPTTRP